MNHMIIARTPSAEGFAELAARQASWEATEKEHAAFRSANPELFSETLENSVLHLGNVANMSADEADEEIGYVTSLIQSGSTGSTSVHGANGEQQTSSLHEYLYWLQLHARNLRDDGTYSPATVIPEIGE
jgi:hypothetical protein